MFFSINAIDKMIKKSNIAVYKINEKNDNFTLFLTSFILCIIFTFLLYFCIAFTDCDSKTSI